ncbi:MAG: hypothetical protein KAS32_19210 [Candidatus Peribacteraceae bacterium]|nr:hypothetical protein [Candidatus Peribacteraceae bacterium]
MIEIGLERVLDTQGDMAFKIRRIKALPRDKLPQEYVNSLGIRCFWSDELGQGWHKTSGLGIAGLLAEVYKLASSGDEMHYYPIDTCHLVPGQLVPTEEMLVILGFIYKAGCNLLLSRKLGLLPRESYPKQRELERLLHLSPNKDGLFDIEKWKGFVTVRI